MSANNSMSFVVAAVLVLGLLGGGLYLAGVFDSEAPAPVHTPTVAGEPAKPPDPAAEPKKPITPSAPIEARSFTSRDDRGTTTAAIEGDATQIKVWGVIVDPDGRPLIDAEVALIRDVSAIRSRPQDGEILARLRTGRTGAFAFENVVPGELYVVQAGHKDFTTQRRHPIDPQNATTLDLGEIRLEAGLDIGGTISDNQGRPLEGAEVLVHDMNVQTLDAVSEPERSVKTGADGKYVAAHLVAGLKKVTARKAGYSSDGRNALDVREGQPLQNVDFSLSSGHTIGGMVTDASTNRPVKGALILARPINYLVRPAAENPVPDAGVGPPPDVAEFDEHKQSRLIPGQHDEEIAAKRARALAQQEAVRQGSIAQKSFLIETAYTDENGRFELVGLMEARYTLQVKAAGFQPNTQVPADAGTRDLSIPLTPSARIRGRVVDDETGQPVAVFSVAAVPNPDAAFIPAQLRQRFKDADGVFEYTDVRPGQHYLVAEGEGYAGGRSEPVQVAAQQQVEGIVIRMAKGARLSGLVAAADGAPVGGARVDLVAAGAGSVAGMADNPFTRILQQQMRANSTKRAVTGADGRWTLDHVLAGSYKVKVEHPDYSEAESRDFTCENKGDVNVDTVTLRPGAVIRGLVKKKDGSPDGRATIMVSSADPMAFFSRSIQTNADGSFEVKGLKAGSYKVMVTQRDGVFDLVAILQKTQDPGAVVTLRDGDKHDVSF